MSKMDVDELVNKAYDGCIEPEELAEAVDRIQKFYDYPNNEDIYSLLQVVGYAGIFCNLNQVIDKYRGLIEKFIVFPKDPSVSVAAFGVLCNDWDLTAEYISQIKMYIRGVEWDEGEDMRVKAMCIAGRYIKESGDKELLRMLLEVFENEREEKITREIAYDSISVALGSDWTVLPQIDIDTFSQNVVAQEIIAKAYELLTKE